MVNYVLEIFTFSWSLSKEVMPWQRMRHLETIAYYD